MKIGQRIKKLEARAQAVEYCTCGGLRVVYANPDEAPSGWAPEPEICPRCGKPRVTVRVVYEHPSGGKA